MLAAPAAARASAAPGTGVGVDAAPVCYPAPVPPGGATAPQDLTVYDTGSTGERITVRVVPLAAGGELAGHARPVPASWVSVGYPRLLGLIGQSSVSVSPGGTADLPVTVHVPVGAPSGAYGALLDATTGGSGGSGLSLGAGADTDLLFLVGVRQPAWPPRLLALGCWTPAGQRVPWQEFSGTSYATAPPGWSWGRMDDPAEPENWYYSPPAGWAWDWAGSNPRQVYRGARPARPCVSPAQIASYNRGNPGPGGWWVGHGFRDSSSAAGCAAWLAASADGGLRAEPSLPTHRSAAHIRRLAAQAAADTSPAGPRKALPELWIIAGIAAAALLLWRLRRRAR